MHALCSPRCYISRRHALAMFVVMVPFACLRSCSPDSVRSRSATAADFVNGLLIDARRKCGIGLRAG
jgi:hypothetical protein